MRLYYAQNKEDLLIKSFFPDVKKGFYIDVGANDPVLDSVTKLFYDEGWSGINVEPIAKHFKALQEQRKRDKNLNIGLSNEDGELTFREYVKGDGLSTLDPSMMGFYERGKHPFPTSEYKEYRIPVKTLHETIAENGDPHIHFIKIDVEGYEYEVIKGNNWQISRPELICIEANHINKDWRPILKKAGYEEVFFDGVNGYYLAKESLRRREYFNYPDAVFAGNPVYYPAYLEIESQVSEEVHTVLGSQIEKLSEKVHDQEMDIAHLHRQQRDVRFLAKRLAQETQLRLNRRAKGAVKQAGLYYSGDTALAKKVAERDDDKEELIAFIHQRDQVNIHQRHVSLSQVFKPIPWKMAAWSFSFSLLAMKKAARKVM